MMRFFKKWHRWISILVTIPFTITLVTGILMSTRSYNTWIQPDYPIFKSELNLTFPEILEIAKKVPEAKINKWSDVSQIDIRPANGNIRVRSKSDMWEVQINGQTGEITSSAKRRMSFLVSLHEGSYFGELVRYGIFFPSALGVLFLLLSGVYIYIKFYKEKILKSS